VKYHRLVNSEANVLWDAIKIMLGVVGFVYFAVVVANWWGITARQQGAGTIYPIRWRKEPLPQPTSEEQQSWLRWCRFRDRILFACAIPLVLFGLGSIIYWTVVLYRAFKNP
jgi:hypothetical protein